MSRRDKEYENTKFSGYLLPTEEEIKIIEKEPKYLGKSNNTQKIK